MLNLDKNKTYLLACSFGPDSMALFSMLKNEGYKFKVAHVNYGVREEAKEETIKLNEYCAKNDIEIDILYCKNLNKKSNFEAKAREIRYNFFSNLQKKHNFDALLVAHNQDDFIETYYLQIKRRGFVDYYGIKEINFMFNIKVIRPLLNLPKKELENYCKNNGIPYAIDSSNLSLDFQRNIIRHTIVENMNERERNNLLKSIELLNKEIDLKIKHLNSLNLHNKDVLLSLNDEEFQRAVLMLGREIKNDFAISSSLSKEIKKILLSKKPNVSFEINKGFYFKKEYDSVFFSYENKDYIYSFIIEKPSILETEFFKLDFTNGASNRNISNDSYPLTIRNNDKNDEITITNYKVKVRRLLIDWKVPLSFRKKWPVILDKNGCIIYTPRYRKDYKIKPNENFIVKL